ncbi:glutathione S-transferase family protein [Oceanicola granulosus HTCC2516]|uniref:Glutathione S-transferase family protein n=1 Tax=Oceanicola granulosus (strain ATCC BAA-861 / DSM 15982 / KCTC 12143 / HTCC2516) TaxID=314256 RepID=Q2CE32_OCEGH|nr:glutathione S-transferase [Oceanicola granulosus]EAR50906.1 glutathione S-transferase family protein [Oceanicola granulosus HTCC2516]
MRLHCFGESGNAYKVALMLNLTGADWEAVPVGFFGGATRTPEFRALNAMGEVPVLEDGAVTLSQSGAILDYLAEKTGRFGGRDADARREVLRWLLFDAHKLSGLAGPLRFNMNFLPEARRSAEINGWLAGRLAAALKVLEAHLEGRDWIAGPEATLADFACCGYLFYEEPFTFARAEWPAIDAWLGRLEALPGWAHPYDLMPRAFPPKEET